MICDWSRDTYAKQLHKQLSWRTNIQTHWKRAFEHVMKNTDLKTWNMAAICNTSYLNVLSNLSNLGIQRARYTKLDATKKKNFPPIH